MDSTKTWNKFRIPTTEHFFKGGRRETVKGVNFVFYWWRMQRNRERKWRSGGDANLLLPVLPALSSQLSVFSKLCIMNTFLHFLLLLFQLCGNLRNISLGGHILRKSKVIITVGWVWWHHHRAPLFSLASGPPNLKPTTACVSVTTQKVWTWSSLSCCLIVPWNVPKKTVLSNSVDWCSCYSRFLAGLYYYYVFNLDSEPSPESLQWGLCVCARGLDILKFDKNSTIYSVSYFNLGRLGSFSREDQAHQSPRGDETAWIAFFECSCFYWLVITTCRFHIYMKISTLK